jgi:hypothetical protein
MKVDQATKMSPTFEGAADAIVIERCPQTEPFLQVIAGSNVIARKYMNPS